MVVVLGPPCVNANGLSVAKVAYVDADADGDGECGHDEDEEEKETLEWTTSASAHRRLVDPGGF